MAFLCRKLATTSRSGIPVVRNLELQAGTRKGRLHRTLAETADDIRQGASLAEALRRRKCFPDFFSEMIACMEPAGALDAALADLADYYEHQMRVRRTIIQMLAYPAMLVFTATVVIPFFKGYMTAKVQGGSAEADFFLFCWHFTRARLPTLTAIALLAAAYGALFRLGIMQKVTAPLGAYLWPFSCVARSAAMARFYRAMSILHRSGLKASVGIRQAAKLTLNRLIEKDLVRAGAQVQEGLSLADALGASRFVTPSDSAMIEVGEESGKLDAALHKLSEYRLAAIPSPVNIILIGLGALLVAAIAYLFLMKIATMVRMIFQLLPG
ncbi:MAG TPA: hypothetical protein HPP83_11900 [Candidatus Hydrogenedentes bacterium]|nr:hypothetical protein [Candidatus Hydrogenedentota bacterium]